MKNKTLDDFLPIKKSGYTKKFENFYIQKKLIKKILLIV